MIPLSIFIIDEMTCLHAISGSLIPCGGVCVPMSSQPIITDSNSKFYMLKDRAVYEILVFLF
jgi:hypothetical protein